MATSLRNVSDWLFRDRTNGRIVIAQMPNAAAWTALAAWAFRLIVPAGRMAAAAGYVLVAALLLWALDEIARGSIRGGACSAPVRWSRSPSG